MKLEDLKWLAGSWEGPGFQGEVEEVWMKPSWGSMVGMGRTVVDGKTAFFEFLRLEQTEEGVVYYALTNAVPGKAKEPVPFKLTHLDDMYAVFENPEHDFPQKITYERKGDDLTAVVSGNAQGKEISEELHLKRSPL